MSRYTHIQTATFDQVNLPHPISIRLTRCVEPTSACYDNKIFPTSVEILGSSLTAEIRIRGTAAAEGLSLGQQGDLSFTVSPAAGGDLPRDVTLEGAVLVSVELSYQQAALATATLRFVAEATDGDQEPFSAEDSQ